MGWLTDAVSNKTLVSETTTAIYVEVQKKIRKCLTGHQSELKKFLLTSMKDFFMVDKNSKRNNDSVSALSNNSMEIKL